mgnify:CR=1 FL=1
MANSWSQALMLFACVLLSVDSAEGARISDVRGTKHNFSSAADASATPSGGTVPTRNVKATSETQICVFCHTPHGASAGVSPLWNRKLSEETYTPYSSLSLDAETIRGSVLGQPGGSSKLCLSCHDGTLAIGSVNVLNGAGSNTTQGTQSIAMQPGTGAGGTMPAGSGATAGFTRRLGTELGNDHPISLDYTNALAARDGELRVVDENQKYPASSGEIIGVRGSGYKPKLPLEATGGSGTGQVQCATCHDPHIRETDTTKGNQKFLRMNRFQEVQPSATYNQNNDIICLACHDKAGASWAYSAHANSLVATQNYETTAATVPEREFPANLPVWKAACLNCHDTHTVQGARRLLREGTDSTSTPKAGGNPALEETCYQCHTNSGAVITPLTTVPNIETDFTTSGNKRMPNIGTENHNIGGNFNDPTFIDCTSSTNNCGKDFIEQRTLLGSGGNLGNRHAECTDCHNPHRVVKFRDFRGAAASGSLQGSPDASGTHPHTDAAGYTHTNIASGVLRGAWGVEPIYGSASFHVLPTGYTVKRGDPAGSTDATVGAAHVTREYQICLKCHSDYAYSDDNVYPNSTARPQLGGTNLTAQNANGHSSFTSYTNQAKEFQAPSTHAVAVGSVSLGNNGGTGTAASNANNHRSWHPVMRPTGRTGRSGTWIAPWNNSGTGGQANRLGNQTMYCSDCHGSSTGTTASVIPTGGEDGSPWGPHGSSINFLLKGEYSTSSGEGVGNTLCFKCHSQSAYSGGGGTGWSTDRGDGHSVHSNRIDNPLRCNWCHIAVPHGWKNRNLLVNLLDVGAEAGLAPGTAVSFTNNVGYSNGPYYRKAFLRVISFPSGQWTESNCNGGSKSVMKNNCEVPN